MSDRPSSHQRVCVFIDNTSLLEAIRDRSIRYDFKRLKDWLLGQRNGQAARFYCGGGEGRGRFHSVLRHAGFEVVLAKSGRRPLELAFDMCNFCSDGLCDIVVLVSGRAELAKVVPLLTRTGIEVELVFFEDLCSRDLLATATTFRNLRVDGLELDSRSRRGIEGSSQKVLM